MCEVIEDQRVVVRPFEWADWSALWQLRRAQLAEHGILLAPGDIAEVPLDVGRGAHEWDYHHLSELYLTGAGGFWIAWQGDEPLGHIGAQDLGGALELRRMYVRRAHRRHGVGTRLVEALVRHARTRGIGSVELWTGPEGPGRRLYERLGFRTVAGPGPGYEQLEERTGYTPGADEIRMRLELAASESRTKSGRSGKARPPWVP